MFCQVIQCFRLDEEVEKVFAGDNIKLKLKGIDDKDVFPGSVICSPNSPCSIGRIFDAEVNTFALKDILTNEYSCVIYIHGATEKVKIKVS